MKYNDNILERIGEFYTDLDIGMWTDFLSRKPEGFDNMDYSEKCIYTYPMMQKIDKLMEDPWDLLKVWARRVHIKNPKNGTYFDTFMEYELDCLKQKEQYQDQQNLKKHFWNWRSKENK